jgi:hypothetical protein
MIVEPVFDIEPPVHDIVPVTSKLPVPFKSPPASVTLAEVESGEVLSKAAVPPKIPVVPDIAYVPPMCVTPLVKNSEPAPSTLEDEVSVRVPPSNRKVAPAATW